jgi:hypothetical protein
MRATLLAASQLLPSMRGFLAWMEPDQDDFVRFVYHLTAELIDQQADVAAPRRPPNSLAGYPPEQVHAETLGNLYLNALLASHSASLAAYSSTQQSPPKAASLDWFFGPVVIRASLAHHWHSCSIALQHEPRTVALLTSLLTAVSAGCLPAHASARAQRRCTKPTHV